MTDAEARAMKAEDLDFHRRDLWEAIGRQDYPAWRLEMQIMPYEDAADYRFNPFDITKVWPHKDYPTIPIGRMVLNRNPENFFAQVVQAGFEVSNMVPGIGPSPDRMVLGRMFAYGDSQRYRTGPNYAQLPVNQPLGDVHNYNIAWHLNQGWSASSRNVPSTTTGPGSTPTSAPASPAK
ncbi:catalase [Dactylosporangium cerinum]